MVMNLNVSTFCGFPAPSDFEIVGREVGDRIALPVGDDDVDADRVDAGAERRLLRLLRLAAAGGGGADVVWAASTASDASIAVTTPAGRRIKRRHARLTVNAMITFGP